MPDVGHPPYSSSSRYVAKKKKGSDVYIDPITQYQLAKARHRDDCATAERVRLVRSIRKSARRSLVRHPRITTPTIPRLDDVVSEPSGLLIRDTH